MTYSDGIHTANLPETAAAFDAAESECMDHTNGEYGFVATLGQAVDFYDRCMALDPHMIALMHAARIAFALLNDANL